ncbi:MAG: hypothetical protein NTW48_04045, partial [Chloroflexi bacterium]|nr:hypothetical protein [Chloroflexota bacterium]
SEIELNVVPDASHCNRRGNSFASYRGCHSEARSAGESGGKKQVDLKKRSIGRQYLLKNHQSIPYQELSQR